MKLAPPILLAAALAAPGAAAPQDLEVFRAEDVKPARPAEGVKPVAPAAEPAPVRAVDVPRPARNAQRDRTPARRAKPAAAKDLSWFFRVWRTRVPGAVWTSPSPTPGWELQHVAAGAEAGDLTIFRDGSYVWNSYGGKRGKWLPGEDGASIVLVDTVEKKRWTVARDPRREGGRDLVVMDGSLWYDGRM